MKKITSLLAASLLAVSAAVTTKAATTADIVFVVDESGSMAGEHTWLSSMVTSLDTQLGLAGVTGNRYGLVGFGAANPAPHQINVGGGAFGTAAQFGAATGSLVTSGGTEDGWAGINFGLTNYTFRAGAAVNFVLVTDEDRDNTNAALSFNSILAGLQAQGALLNAVVNGDFRTSTNGVSLGHDSDTPKNAYVADGAGGFTVALAGSATGFGTTITDYYNLALATGGAAWDLNQLRSGGNAAVSFTKAFVDIKVQEIVVQPGVPEGGTSALMLLGGLAMLAALRRRLLPAC